MAEAYFRVGLEEQERQEEILQKWRRKVGMEHDHALDELIECILSLILWVGVPVGIFILVISILVMGG